MATQLHPARASINGTGRDHPAAESFPDALAKTSLPDSVADLEDPPGLGDAASFDVAELRRENAQLRELLDQARERLRQAEKAANHWKVREQEYENLLEEKSEVIRALHAQLEGGGENASSTDRRAPREEELISLQQELEQEREQLRQDEEALMAEMRNMEITMSRERADLARQRSELQRLQNELKHELEIASRDAALREKLAPLYRLQDEILRRRPGTDSSSNHRPASQSAQEAPAPAPPAEKSQKKSGFLRRMFKKG